jgi:hypothetical protein
MSAPSDEELLPYEIRSKHSIFLGVLCALSVAAAAICWFSTTVVYNRRAAEQTDADAPYEAFLDQDFLTWWNWSWIFVAAAVVLFVGAVIADAFNVHSSRLAYLMHHPPQVGTIGDDDAKDSDPAES